MGVSENGVPCKKQGNIGLDGEHAGISGGFAKVRSEKCVLMNLNCFLSSFAFYKPS